MNAVWVVFKEHFRNFYLIQRLAQFQVKISNTNNYLGMAWELINPALQILVYWFVFGLGIRSNGPIDGVPFIYWLLVGISMWFFINQGVLEGTKSIATKYNQVSKMNFPLSIVPTYIVMSRFYGHLGLLAIVMILCMIGGFYPSIYTLQLLIYVPMALVLTTSIALFTSTLGVLVRDTQQAIQALMRMVFFASSILIVPPDGIVKQVMQFNPIYYLAEAYRAAVLHKEWYFITHWELTLYNVGFILFMFVVGAFMHMRYRDHFADFM
ncbi:MULTISPECIES: ABC transporter permease [Staphylococcus]|uniref:Transport permease protein n=1 Tax=Staphylococcus hsinchuensis TaxID=3051183 RepID=A0ABZ3EG01_9STAP|nr:ABC transporter permease [Staphylococcus sp. Marseille-Q6910]